MSLLVVMAHFDVRRTLRRHTLRTIQTYANDADRVMVVSTSGVRDSDLSLLPANVEFVTRPNFGYDFFSYKWALDLVGDYGDYDRIVISNDSFIGPFVSLEAIVESERASLFDLMGMTWSRKHGGHAQSFFVTVNGRVARSNGFQRFWRDMTPVSDRTKVILGYEVGLSASVVDAGFAAGGFFVPSTYEEELAMARFMHESSVRLRVGRPGRVIRDSDTWTREFVRAYNPAVALADRVLLEDRLPLLKFDTLRFDPYGLGARHLLETAEAARPDLMDGVRDFLRDTRPDYPYRRGEQNALSSPSDLRRSGLGYCMDDEFVREGISRGAAEA